MKKKMWILALGMTMVSLMGCNGKASVDVASTNAVSQQESAWDYTDLATAMGKVREVCEALGDWTVPEENYYAFIPGIELERSAPIFVIYVNPIANEEVMDDYVQLALAIDKVYNDNADYKTYCKEQEPFTIAFDCHEKVIATMVLNGENTEADIRNMLVTNMADIREEVSEALADMEAYKASYENIQVDEDGNYYFVADSTAITRSIEEIASYVEDIKAYNPIGEDEYQNYNGSARIMGKIAGSYKVYLDEYGGENVFFGTGGWSSGDFDFSMNADELFYVTYMYLMGDGSEKDIVDGFSYYHSINFPGRAPYMQLQVEEVTGDTNEEVIEGIYKIYSYIVESWEKYGIEPWCDLGFYAQYDDPEDLGNFMELNCLIPMDTRFLTLDDFKDWFLANCEQLPQGYYNLEADCVD